ncbi:hypothetical protein RRG08_065440 [Elysia crispata]|uniref:C2 domain-containing protein n=1 Tax=Elysia crispata TaxID=231223 RepID=A0AAE1DEV9_9GAST|nr:hypothetical protein RRG08_065440 [Elysia crispata]
MRAADSSVEKESLVPVYGAMYDPAMDVTRKKGSFKRSSQQSQQWYPMLPLRESELSDWSDISMPEVIEMKQDSHSKSRKSSRTSDYSSSASSVVSPVQPESRLAYGFTFDPALSRLNIRVIQLGNFRVTDPDGALSPYVKIRVYRLPKQFFTFNFKLKSGRDLPVNHLVAEMQTKIHRRTDNPVFNEGYDVSVDAANITSYVVKFLVCDFDRFSRHVNVGEVTCDLSKLELRPSEEVLFNDLIEGYNEEELGEIHVALMYLPTAEKLSVTLLNARSLPALEGTKKNMETYVKILMMYDGRPLKKSKTACRTANDANPVYNETFVFDVPPYQLDKVYFNLAVIGVNKDKEEGRSLLGRLYIGVNFDPDVRAQWLEMVHNARKQVACWHRLQS